MSSFVGFLKSLRRDERGMTTVEYVIALCLVGAVAVGMWGQFGNTIRTRLMGADSLISGATDEAVKKGASGSAGGEGDDTGG